VNLEAAVVVDEAEFPELVHEKIHARPRRPDDFREHFLRDSWQHTTWSVRPPIAREQEERAGQPFFAGVEQLIDEVFLEPCVPGEHMRDEPVRERVLLMEQADHLPLGNHADPARDHRGRRREAKRLTGQRAFAKEIALAQHSDDRFFAALRQHGQLHAPLLNVKDGVGWVALRVDGGGRPIVHDPAPDAGRIEERCHAELSLLRLDHAPKETVCNDSAAARLQKPGRAD